MSPNDDGRNDVFKIDCALNYPNNEIVIFNRWGNEVYSSKPYKNDWKGTYQNAQLPDGTYYYIFKFNDDKHKDKQGYIVIHK
jgi:gliding motility-associated-like protein